MLDEDHTAGDDEPVLSFTYVKGPNDDMQEEVEAGETKTLGRQECDFEIDLPCVSRKHLALSHSN